MMKLNHSIVHKMCSVCGRRMPSSFQGDICEACNENRLFEEVRDYIRTHSVTEAKLAEIFDISPRKIHQWISDGSIQFNGLNSPKRIKGHCMRCGDPLDYGAYCSSCLRLIHRHKTSDANTDISNISRL